MIEEPTTADEHAEAHRVVSDDAPESPSGVAATFTRVVWSIAAAGLVARLVLQRFEPLPPFRPCGGIVSDEAWYTRMAHNVLKGRGFVSIDCAVHHGPSALHGPLTVFLLLPASLIEPNGYTAQRATVAVLGALTVVVLARIGTELAGPRVGIVTAVLAAIYPGLWVNDLVATSESPAILLLSLMVLLTMRYRRAPTTGRLVQLGLLAGLLALDRAELAVLGVLLVVPAIVDVARRASSPATAVRALLVVGVLAVGVVAPWSVYNQQRFHQTVLISNNLGQTLVGANCSESYYGKLAGYDGRYCYLPIALSAPKHLNEAQLDAYFRRQAEHYALRHWTRWPVVGALRELWLWSLWQPGWTVFMSGVYLGRAQWLAWSQIVGFWLLTPFALYGFAVARRRRLRVAPLVTMVAFTALLGLLVVGHLRYRVPAEIAWVLFGAVGIDRLCSGRPMGARADVHDDDVAPLASVRGDDLG